LHALLISSILAHLDFLDEHISGLSEAIEEQIAPFAAARNLLMTIPGQRLGHTVTLHDAKAT
jgi:hypothetical protein